MKKKYKFITILLSLSIASCYSEEQASYSCDKLFNDPDKLDNGCNYKRPMEYPVTIRTIDYPKEELEYAVEWWLHQIERHSYNCIDCGMPPLAIEIVDTDDAIVSVFYEDVPVGIAAMAVSSTLPDGRIYKGMIKMGYIIHEKCTLIHEIGHAVFGLSDDSPDFPISIMSWHCNDLSIITARDMRLIFRDMSLFLD